MATDTVWTLPVKIRKSTTGINAEIMDRHVGDHVIFAAILTHDNLNSGEPRA